MVPTEGVEPTRYHYHQILSLARLPIPPRRHQGSHYKTNPDEVNDIIRLPMPAGDQKSAKQRPPGAPSPGCESSKRLAPLPLNKPVGAPSEPYRNEFGSVRQFP